MRYNLPSNLELHKIVHTTQFENNTLECCLCLHTFRRRTGKGTDSVKLTLNCFLGAGSESIKIITIQIPCSLLA